MGSALFDESPQEAAGRRDGSDSYNFGDLSRSLVRNLRVPAEQEEGTKAAEGTKEAEAAPLACFPRRIKRYGWRRDLPDHRDLWADLSHIFSALPEGVDLRTKFHALDLYDQGDLGSCTANAIAAAMFYDEHREKIRELRPSRLFIYYNERSIEGTCDADCGAQLRDGIKVVSKFGICDEALWPYDPAKFAARPPAVCYAAALETRTTRYYRVPQQLEQLKGCLAAGFPFVFGFVVLTSFTTAAVAETGEMPMPIADDEQVGGHAVCAVGYDDARRVFIVRNSWGDHWGDGGYFFMPYEYATSKGLADDFWTIRWVD